MLDRRVPRTNTFLSRFVFLLSLLQVPVSSLLLDLRALSRDNNDRSSPLLPMLLRVTWLRDSFSCSLPEQVLICRFVFSRSNLPIRLS